MQKRKEKILDSISDIMIDIYLVGYSTQGESILFILYANKPQYRVLYSIVIDCFEENINATQELLDNILTDKLDMLIWTHPHDDHSKGIVSLIDNYCSKDTQIILADILVNGELGLSNDCNQTREWIAQLNKGLKHKYDINHMVHFDEQLKQMTFDNAESIKNMEIKCIAPISSINAKQAAKKQINLNDICVAVIIKISLKNDMKMNFMFSGDIENEVWGEICYLQDEAEIPSTYNFIKIPHHGGRSAEKMKGILVDGLKSEYAASTVYINKIENGKSSNPDVELLKEYKNYIDNIGCTSDIINNKYGLGMLRINYSLSLFSCTIDAFGSAVKKIV